MIELYHLKTFLAIVHSQSFSGAARELFLTQSTLTRQIQELEKELGFPLFDRDGRSIRVTTQGHQFITYAEQSLSLMEEALHSMNQHDRAEGTVRVASLTSFCTYVLPPRLHSFQQQFPAVEISITTGHTRPIIDQVLKGKIDIGLVRGPIDQSGLISVALQRDKIVPIIAPGHPWAKEPIIPLSAIHGQRLIAYNRFSRIWAQLEDWFRAHKVEPEILMDLDHMETSKQMAMKGHGIAFLPLFSVQKEIDTGKLATFETDPPFLFYSCTDLIYNRRNALPSQVRVLIDFLLSNAAQENGKEERHVPEPGMADYLSAVSPGKKL